MSELRTPSKPKPSPSPKPKPSPSSVLSFPSSPDTPSPRRSSRHLSSVSDPETPAKSTPDRRFSKSPGNRRTESKKSLLSPSRKRKRSEKPKSRTKKKVQSKKRVYYRKVVYDGGEFEIGDDVYVRRRENASSDEDDPEVEECRICFRSGKALMIECDDCLGGYHLKCLKPPLKEIPEGDWTCRFCEARKQGKHVELPVPPPGKKRRRTAREKLLSSDLWAAKIERIPAMYHWLGHWVASAIQQAVNKLSGHHPSESFVRKNIFACRFEGIECKIEPSQGFVVS